MERRIRRKLSVARVPHDDTLVVAPFGDDRVARTGDGAAEHVESRPEVAYARRRERANAARKVTHETASRRSQPEDVIQHARCGHGGASTRARNDQRIRLIPHRREGDLVVGATERRERARCVHCL